MGTTGDGRAERIIRNNSRAISGSEREESERTKVGKCDREIESLGEREKRRQETKRKTVTGEIISQY